jgi:hypothetical protein
LLPEAEKDSHDVGAGGRVEISSRLVGEDDVGVHGEGVGVGDGDALHLATRELRRLVVNPVAEADPIEELGNLRPPHSWRHASEDERHLDVLEGRDLRLQIERLEVEADAAVPEVGDPVPREPGDLLAADEVMPRFAGDPEAASAFEWGGVAWGMYALAEGIFAAAREGAAARIRDCAEAVIRLAPALDDAAGDRTLGRLHHKTPSIPLITGWISKKEAIRHLRKAVAVAPSSLVNRLFLAEALRELDPSGRDESIAIAERVVEDLPDPKWIVEHEKARADARAFLKSWKGNRG